MSDIQEDDNNNFVIFVPPYGSNKAAESCLRLGAGPFASQLATADENTTYNDAVATAQALGPLSLEKYQPTSGIALLTPGTINLVAAGGVNTTCGNYSYSTIGSSYSVTQDPDSKRIVSASYTSNNLGMWATSSFNQAATVSVNTVPLQASIVLGPTYSVSGPISLSNNWGAMWSSTFGWSVTAQLARNVAIGWRTVVVTDSDGSTNQYYTPEQGQSTGAQFKWMVPVAGKYASFDLMQKVYCRVVNAASLAASAIAEVYALVGAAKAHSGTPSDVQGWLKAAEPIAIACTVIDSLCWAAGVVLGFIVDYQARDENPDNDGATTFTIGDGTYLLSTGDAAKGPTLYLDRDAGLTSLGKKDKYLALSDDNIVITFGADIKVTLNKTSVKLTAKDHSITVANDGIAIAGQKVTIDATTFKNHSLDAKFDSMQEQLDKANQAAATAEHDAIDAQVQIALLKAQLAAKNKK